MKSREEATIESVSYGLEDHGILTFFLYLNFGGSGQGFGGIALDERTGADLKRSLAEFFGKPFDSLVGTKCFALRSFTDLSSRIDGIENERGERFTLYRWGRKHWPGTISPLAQRVASIQGEIRHLRRRLAEEEARLERVSAEYVDWET